MATRQKSDCNAHWYLVLDKAVNGDEFSSHTRGLLTADWATHAGATGPGFMYKLDHVLGKPGIGDCDTFVDVGSGIGTVAGYVLKRHRRMMVYGIELEVERVEIAKRLMRRAGLYNDKRLKFITGSFTEQDNWLNIVEGPRKVCVWINATNFVGERLECLQAILTEMITIPGSVIMTTERLLTGQMRRSRQDDNDWGFEEDIRMVEVEKTDFSWTVKSPLKVYIYRRRQVG